MTGEDEPGKSAERSDRNTGCAVRVPFPYMMCMHQDPVNSGDVSGYYHFHIEFFPPMRSANKQKFNASSETGAWAHANTTKPEEKAAELRDAHKRFMDSQGK